MVEKFINPNWHVIFIHYPLGLLIVGLVIELLSLHWQRERFRAAGRWMIAIGGLMSVVAALAGIYAFRNVVISGPTNPDFKWTALAAMNHWNAMQWKYLTAHIWFNSFSVLIFIAVVALWLSRGDEWRAKFHWLMLLLLIIGTGLVMTGAWYGGEMVYRYGTAVRYHEPTQTQPAVNVGPEAREDPAKGGKAEEEEEGGEGLAWVVPPLQLHVVIAGVTAALGIVALGLTFHGWSRSLVSPDTTVARTAPPGATPLPEITRLPAARFWIAALVTGAITAVAGVWSVLGVFSVAGLKEDWKMLIASDHRRLLVHVIAGVCLIVLTIILAIVNRLTQGRHRLKAVFVGLFLVAVFIQVWLGTLMLFDSHEGPLTGFSAKAAEQPGHEPVHSRPATAPAGGMRK